MAENLSDNFFAALADVEKKKNSQKESYSGSLRKRDSRPSSVVRENQNESYSNDFSKKRNKEDASLADNLFDTLASVEKTKNLQRQSDSCTSSKKAREKNIPSVPIIRKNQNEGYSNDLSHRRSNSRPPRKQREHSEDKLLPASNKRFQGDQKLYFEECRKQNPKDEEWQRVYKHKHKKDKSQPFQNRMQHGNQENKAGPSGFDHKLENSLHLKGHRGKGRTRGEDNSCQDDGFQISHDKSGHCHAGKGQVDEFVPRKGEERKYVMGYKQLETLAEEDPSEVVIVLANTRSGFENILKQQMRPDLLVLVLKVLSNLCKADFEENKAAILSFVCQHDFIDQLSKHIAILPLETNKKRKENIGNFFGDLVIFMETVINLFPNTAMDNFEKLFMMTDVSMKCCEDHHTASFSGDLKTKYEHLKIQFKTCVEEQEKKKVSVGTNVQVHELITGDFRDVSLFPDPEDILSEEPAVIRPNIVDGAYQSVDHYLDTQFRLLREDFIAPLREGISEYINMGDKKFKKINNVRIYRKVYFLNPKIIKDRLGLIVQFDPDKHLKKVIWEHTKRFLYGALLLFSRDNFTNVIFATIMERDVKELKKGQIVVQLSEGTEVSNDLFTDEFVMAESQVYFEPYYHVLKALQNMSDTSFPMEKYIIRAQISDDPPKYMCTEGSVLLDIDGHSVSVLKDESWPGPEKLKLDNSQYSAFKSALTKEFVVVQGPPGTGKTFLGLKVATVLLKNAPVWNADRKPILVVCYTNHALDQFLEGLVSVTDKIVRIGGQSKSKILDCFNLKEKRRGNSKQRAIFHLMRDIRYRMSSIMHHIQRVQVDLEMISSHEGIISLDILKEMGINDQHLACFQSHDPKVTEKLFTDWLEFGMYDVIPPAHAEGNPNENLGENVGENEQEEAVLDDIEDRQQHVLDDLMDFELDVYNIFTRLKFALDLNKIQEEIEWTELQIQYIETQSRIDPKLLDTMQNQQALCEDMKLRFNYIKRQLSREDVHNRRTLDRLLQHHNLWELQAEERWILYRYWVDRLRNVLLLELHRLEVRFRTECRMFEEAQQINDLELLRDNLVVGMTTTGAARLQTLLQALKTKIVIVEEAAEVLESHIVVSLTRHCEHLILIGDHQQLRPSTAVFKLARDYNFDISLFERMLKNKMHCEVLKVQHRMRPEIAQLIVPTIYPELQNHNSVLQFEKINGMLKSVFFITHHHLEEEVQDISSHRNTHEGDFLIALCRHLVLQGYEPSRITILATYSGQLFYLRSVRKQYNMLSEVRITVVDNFQGEENDIILLSLVRSNKEAKIGFLKVENRVCVALSRAKMGFYIIGNMDNLTKSSKIWPKIRDTLKSQDAVGTHLTLRCQVHPLEFTSVSTAADFHKVPEGGCSRLCGAELSCGHNCKSICHILNREHLHVTCFEKCERIPPRCVLQHPCRKRCWDDCGDCKTLVHKTLPCGHSLDLHCYIDPETYSCKVEVEVELPDCGHKVKKPCYRNPLTFPCSYPCEDRLPCGHSCVLKCHTKEDPDHLQYQCNKPCTRKNAGCKEDHICTKQCHEECGDCKIMVQRQLPHCIHKARMQCSWDAETFLCRQICSKMLPCGHPCPNVCSSKCGNCPVKVTKRIESCGHPLQVKCCEKPDPKLCMKPCERTLPCGHKCTTVCSATCTQKCQELIPSSVRPVCGHKVHIPCYMQKKAMSADSEELLIRCEAPCGAQLNCEHRCKGTCGECMQGRVHKPCKEKCGKTLICGHSCNIPCAESCPPCNRKCMYRCKHSKCSRQCGQPCIQCKEPCEWSCKHKRCTKLCYEECDREPCNEPCDKLLPCKHPCIGFCGETCPPLCRICDEDKVTEVFFGTEDEPDARFVYLEDCKHVLEATGLEQWMLQTDAEIKMKECPLCKTPISKTQRYMNVMKKLYQNVCRVKRRVFGNLREIEANRDELKAKLLSLDDYAVHMQDSTEYEVLYNKLSSELQPVLRNRRNILSSIDTGTIKIQVEILSQLVECYVAACTALDSEHNNRAIWHMDRLLNIVRKREKKIGGQEVEDINLEIQRFHRLCQLFKMKSEPTFKTNKNNSEVKPHYEAARRILYSIERFSKDRDTKLKNLLENLGKAIKSAVRITDAERKEIVKAMGFKQGHWYACPNGHIYIITECGGAMQVGRCNECGAEIGGGSHRLLASNRVATEMDGATRPAWP